MVVQKNHQAVILVHGIWVKGFEFVYLRYRLRKQGYRVYIFRYASLLRTPQENAARLEKFVEATSEPVVHFVAHSLGGIILSHLFNQYKVPRAGKVVTLGTPINGSALAKHLVHNRVKKILLGKAIVSGLLGDNPRWEFLHPPLCVISGIKKIGIGLLLAPSTIEAQSDGTVNLEETRVESASEWHVLPHSHFSMLLSPVVAVKIISFLKK